MVRSEKEGSRGGIKRPAEAGIEDGGLLYAYFLNCAKKGIIMA